MPPWFIPANFKKTQASKLGMPKASPSSSTIYQVTSSETIFLFGHILYILLGASCIFIFSLFAFLFCNKLGWTPAFFYGRETRSAFSLEYSCASLIFVEYSCLDIFSASSSCFACISCSELLAFGSQVVFICVFAWKQECYCGSWYSGKICIVLQITKLLHLNHCCCFEILICLLGKREELVSKNI